MSSSRQGPPPAIPLLLFAAIDVVLALLLLIAGGFSIQFFVVAAIGLALAGIGFWSVFSRVAIARPGDEPPRPLPRLLRPRRRRAGPPPG